MFCIHTPGQWAEQNMLCWFLYMRQQRLSFNFVNCSQGIYCEWVRLYYNWLPNEIGEIVYNVWFIKLRQEA